MKSNQVNILENSLNCKDKNSNKHHSKRTMSNVIKNSDR